MEERRARLMSLQAKISRKRNSAWIGRELDLIVDGISDENEYVWEGRHYGQAPEIDGTTYLSFDRGGEVPHPGDMIRVKITQATEYDLIANPIAPDLRPPPLLP
jgi:ribosomal protein S12 methylthiotransferase